MVNHAGCGDRKVYSLQPWVCASWLSLARGRPERLFGRSGVKPSDHCREKVHEMTRLAFRAGVPAVRDKYRDLSKAWLELEKKALDLERQQNTAALQAISRNAR